MTTPVSAPVKVPKTPSVTIEITPGRPIPALDVPRRAIPRYGFFRLARQADGTYLPVLTTHGNTVRLTGDLARDLGLDVDYNTLMRLYTAGFIKGHRVAPSTILLDLQSIYDHLEATKDPEFWTERRREIYRRAI